MEISAGDVARGLRQFRGIYNFLAQLQTDTRAPELVPTHAGRRVTPNIFLACQNLGLMEVRKGVFMRKSCAEVVSWLRFACDQQRLLTLLRGKGGSTVKGRSPLGGSSSHPVHSALECCQVAQTHCLILLYYRFQDVCVVVKFSGFLIALTVTGFSRSNSQNL